jgi:beta-phosphoglucomutase-like phosphatase (HAD superfamily)
MSARSISAVIFDMDGVLIDSEHIWERVRREYVPQHGGTYTENITGDVMGMSAPEWAEYLRTKAGVKRTAQQINDDVVGLVEASYRTQLPLFPGTISVIRRLAEHMPLAVASSSNRTLIDLVLRLANLEKSFVATVSSGSRARQTGARRLPARRGKARFSRDGVRSRRRFE